MSQKKKKPGNRWMTGRDRTALRKAKVHVTGLVNRNALQPSDQQPFTPDQVTHLNNALSAINAAMNLKS